ncbi:MAG: ComF family protein [Campylobacterota bacterium]|nr:ComF family protein [Campylobacterota bacterium]
MRCISCEDISLEIICKKCQENLLVSSFNKREISKDFFVFSFYRYEDIKELLNSKYEFFGDRVFNILAQLSFKIFADNFNVDETVYAIPIDDHTRHQFSQTAILARSLNSRGIKPVYNSLKASNIVKYAGCDLEYRKKNPRDFKYRGKRNLKVILVDDLVTSGLTIIEAKKKLQEYNCEVLFALTLADVKF